MNREQAIDLKQHPLWEVVRKELDKMIEHERNTLEFTEVPERIARTQERLKMLRGFQKLPQNIIDRETVSPQDVN